MERRETLRFELASYEVIDLLVGNHIYTDPRRVVVRELLQNAVDACRLRRALEPGYTPEILVRWAPGRLVVEDNGIGMTAEVVRNFFLRVGRSYYSSPEFRERYGEVAFAPIARFGIGALSAFLVADRLLVRTRHREAGAAAVALDIEGVHSSIAVGAPPADAPVGTRLELLLRPDVAYPDLAEVVRHWARHLELPVRVEADGQPPAVLPADDGAGYQRQLLEPANYLLLDPARRHQIRTRRIRFAGDGGIAGFIEYLYLESPGRLRLPWSEDGRGLLDVYTENAPRSVSLDGIYVGDQLPCWLAGPGVAYDLNLSSRTLAVQLHLNRKEFVANLPYRKLVEALDDRVAADLVELVQGARLTPVQMAESLANLLDMPRLRRHWEQTGSTAVWDRLAALPIFPRRQGGSRQYLPWAAARAPEVARIPVGHERISFPESAAEQVGDFWWDRHFRLARALAAGERPCYTSLDANPVADAFLEREYAPVRICVEPVLGCSYPVYAPGAPQPPRLAGLPALPFDAPVALTWALGGWVLNAGHPEVAAALALPAGTPERAAAEKRWRDLCRRLAPLPLAADAAEIGAELPAHDTAEWWQQEWERFLLAGGAG